MQDETVNALKEQEQESNNAERLWGESWAHIKTMVDTEVEPFLVLDAKLLVVAVNDAFCRNFLVTQQETKDRYIYELGNHEFDIPALRKLLEDIVLNDTFFKGFEVNYDFPKIGHKVMMLNARQVHFSRDKVPPIILLAFEDVSEMMLVAESFAGHTNQLQTKLTEQTKSTELHIEKLEKEISELKYK